jgi:hypothetical protein
VWLASKNGGTWYLQVAFCKSEKSAGDQKVFSIHSCADLCQSGTQVVKEVALLMACKGSDKWKLAKCQNLKLFSNF